MPTFTANNSAVSAKASEIINSALTELNIAAAGETVSAQDSAWVLEKLQRLIDRFNARREMIFNVSFSLFTLQTNHSPHTIGPGGDFQVNVRPVRIPSVSLVLSSSTPIDIPLTVRDDDWWAAQTIKGLTSTLPTDVYYSPDNPLGSLYFWPVPTAANQVRLEMWGGITQAIDTTTAIALPPAYWDGVVMTLARDIASGYGQGALAIVSSNAFGANYRDAMKAIEGNNQDSHQLISDVPSGGSSVRPGFNFLTGGSR